MTQRRRVAQLQSLNQRLRRATLTRYLGREFPILWERGRDGRRNGYTPNFLKVVLLANGGESPPAAHIRAARLRELSADGEAAVAELLDA